MTNEVCLIIALIHSVTAQEEKPKKGPVVSLMYGDSIEAVAARVYRAEHQRGESHAERKAAQAYQEAEKYFSWEEKSASWNRPKNDTDDRLIVDKG